MEVSDDEIESFLAASGRATRFLGVFSPDRQCAGDERIVNRVLRRRNCSFIVHFADDDDDGSGHYVCIVKKPTHVLYLDSLGTSQLARGDVRVRALLQRIGLPVFANRRAVQHAASRSCWLFVVLFVMLFDGDGDGERLHFDVNDLSSNDARAMAYVRALLTSSQ